MRCCFYIKKIIIINIKSWFLFVYDYICFSFFTQNWSIYEGSPFAYCSFIHFWNCFHSYVWCNFLNRLSMIRRVLNATYYLNSRHGCICNFGSHSWYCFLNKSRIKFSTKSPWCILSWAFLNFRKSLGYTQTFLLDLCW